ncbi:hypothetical protein Tcan_14571 [Toxocara canis]|uniref:Uncharacterized protein n=1 Tax=Toxocara canis TaxID=6265 RepID=A0A0B2VWC8_TOXCA|nr:hypothetical protein Tcan_14571 [Toxocara canis]
MASSSESSSWNDVYPSAAPAYLFQAPPSVDRLRQLQRSKSDSVIVISNGTKGTCELTASSCRGERRTSKLRPIRSHPTTRSATAINCSVDKGTVEDRMCIATISMRLIESAQSNCALIKCPTSQGVPKCGLVEKRRKKRVRKRAGRNICPLEQDEIQSDSDVECSSALRTRNALQNKSITSTEITLRRAPLQLSSDGHSSHQPSSSSVEEVELGIRNDGKQSDCDSAKSLCSRGNVSEETSTLISGLVSHSPSKVAFVLSNDGNDDSGTMLRDVACGASSSSRQDTTKGNSNRQSVKECQAQSEMKLSLQLSDLGNDALVDGSRQASASHHNTRYSREMGQVVEWPQILSSDERMSLTEGNGGRKLMIANLFTFDMAREHDSNVMHFADSFQSSSSSTSVNVTPAASWRSPPPCALTKQAQENATDEKMSDWSNLMRKLELKQKAKRRERENAARTERNANESSGKEAKKQEGWRQLTIRNAHFTDVRPIYNCHQLMSHHSPLNDGASQRSPPNTNSQKTDSVYGVHVNNAPETRQEKTEVVRLTTAHETGIETHGAVAISSRLQQKYSGENNEMIELIGQRISTTRAVHVPVDELPQNQMSPLSQVDEGDSVDEQKTEDELLTDMRLDDELGAHSDRILIINSGRKSDIRTPLSSPRSQFAENRSAAPRDVEQKQTRMHGFAEPGANRWAIDRLYGLLVGSEMGSLPGDEQVLRVILVDGHPHSIDMAYPDALQPPLLHIPSPRSSLGIRPRRTSSAPASHPCSQVPFYDVIRRDSLTKCTSVLMRCYHRTKEHNLERAEEHVKEISEQSPEQMVSRPRSPVASHTATAHNFAPKTTTAPLEGSVKKQHCNKQLPSMRNVFRYASYRLYKDLKMLVAERERTIAALENGTEHGLLQGLSLRFIGKLLENKADLDVRIDDIWKRLTRAENVSTLNPTQKEWLLSVPCSRLLTTHRTYTQQRLLMASWDGGTRTRSSNITQALTSVEPYSTTQLDSAYRNRLIIHLPAYQYHTLISQTTPTFSQYP